MNFKAIKEELVIKGYASSDLTEKAIIINGEFQRNGSIVVTSTKAGFYPANGFFVGVQTAIELPAIEVLEDEDDTEAKFKADIAKMYPHARISVIID